MDAITSSWPPAEAPATPSPPDWREVAHHAVQYQRAIQHSTELAILLGLAADRQVRTVLEIGTYAGGTSWALAHIPTVQRIVTVDRDPQADAYQRIAGLAPRATMIRAASGHPECHAEVQEHLDGNMADLVFIDGSADVVTASEDWRTYGPMTRVGGITVIANVEKPYDRPSPGQALLWARIRTAYPTVKIAAAPYQWAGLGVIFL